MPAGLRTVAPVTLVMCSVRSCARVRPPGLKGTAGRVDATQKAAGTALRSTIAMLLTLSVVHQTARPACQPGRMFAGPAPLHIWGASAETPTQGCKDQTIKPRNNAAEKRRGLGTGAGLPASLLLPASKSVANAVFPGCSVITDYLLSRSKPQTSTWWLPGPQAPAVLNQEDGPQRP